jgi:hypothetical protein
MPKDDGPLRAVFYLFPRYSLLNTRHSARVFPDSRALRVILGILAGADNDGVPRRPDRGGFALSGFASAS